MDSETEIREHLLALRAELQQLRESGRSDQAPIALDQQSVGRLSRMDSLQVQAMDQARDARRQQQLSRIDAALARLDDGDYGWCVKCGEAIDAKRLNNDPAAPFCLECAG